MDLWVLHLCSIRCIATLYVAKYVRAHAYRMKRVVGDERWNAVMMSELLWDKAHRTSACAPMKPPRCHLAVCGWSEDYRHSSGWSKGHVAIPCGTNTWPCCKNGLEVLNQAVGSPSHALSAAAAYVMPSVLMQINAPAWVPTTQPSVKSTPSPSLHRLSRYQGILYGEGCMRWEGPPAPGLSTVSFQQHRAAARQDWATQHPVAGPLKLQETAPRNSACDLGSGRGVRLQSGRKKERPAGSGEWSQQWPRHYPPLATHTPNNCHGRRHPSTTAALYNI